MQLLLKNKKHAKDKMKNIKYHILKSFYFIKGLYRYLFVFKENYKYYGGIKRNAASIYRGNRVFYESLHDVEPTCGVCVFTTRNKQYKFWELGFFNWIEDNTIKVIEDL